MKEEKHLLRYLGDSRRPEIPTVDVYLPLLIVIEREIEKKIRCLAECWKVKGRAGYVKGEPATESEKDDSEDVPNGVCEGPVTRENPLFWNGEADRGVADEDVGLVHREVSSSEQLRELGFMEMQRALPPVPGLQAIQLEDFHYMDDDLIDDMDEDEYGMVGGHMDAHEYDMEERGPVCLGTSELDPLVNERKTT
ncbi:hypothetical protein V6N11_050975 [Hibiscus sabdariffa]|uniref:Uncharacterized protein n=1 Tax=Hibiscus sabdariffa TaxID=183260 RepID=A0ABR2R2G4_9ROSI